MSELTHRPSRTVRPRGLRLPAILAIVLGVTLPTGYAVSSGPALAAGGEVVPPAVGASGAQVTDDPDHDDTAYLLLDTVEPAVVVAGEPVTLTGRVVNHTGESRRLTSLTAAVSSVPLSSRVELADWVDGEPVRETGQVIGDDTIGPVVPAGGAVPFRVVVPESVTQSLSGSPAALALTLTAGPEEDAEGEVDRGIAGEPVTLRTVLTTAGASEVLEPLDVAWVVPLTLPADAGLLSSDDTVHAQAWSAALDPQAPIMSWLQDLTVPGTTYLVDPAALVAHRPDPGIAVPRAGVTDDDTGPTPAQPTPAQPTTATQPDGSTGPEQSDDTDESTDEGSVTSAAPTATGDATGSTAPAPVPDGGVATTSPAEPTPTAPAVPPDEVDLTDRLMALRSAVRRLPDDQVWWLPTDDPDLDVLADQLPTGQAGALLSRPPADAPASVLTLLESGRTDVAWPVGPNVTAEQLDSVAQLYAAREDDGELGVVLLPGEALTGDTAAGPGRGAATLEDPEGVVGLGADSWTSALVAASAADAADHGAGAAAQRVLAHTVGAYLESPGEARGLVIAPPRGTETSPEVLRQLSAGWGEATWLDPVSAESMVEAAGEVAPVGVTDAGPSEEVLRGAASQLQVDDSPVDSSRARGLVGVSDDLGSLAQVFSDTAPLRSWEPVVGSLWSTRWRDDHEEWSEVWGPLRADVRSTLEGIHVTPSTVNFFADRGDINVTVVNELAVGVEDVVLELEASNGRLQVTRQPDPVSIGAGSRATVSFEARAITQGETVLTARVSTPDGTELGSEVPLDVRVQPTGTWLYWVLGGLAGLVLVLGLARAVRRGQPRVGATPGERP